MMRMSGRISSLSMLLVIAPTLLAQNASGSLSGQIKDGQGVPVSGATVTITSPAMMQARVVMTNEKGEYKAPLLPPGDYRVVVAKSGFVGSEARGVRIGMGASARQDLTVKPITTASAVVEVSAASAEVDKSDTKVATNYSAESLEALPVMTRSLQDTADLSAGFAMGTNGQLSVRGSATSNTMLKVNGVDIKDDFQGVQLGQWYVEDAIEDIQAVVSPLHARNGRALGGSVNAITKSGGNEFTGSIRAKFSRDSWGSNGPRTVWTPGALNAVDDLSRTYDITFAGPILKDRLWFAYAGTMVPKTGNVVKISSAPKGVNSFVRTLDPLFDALPGLPHGFELASEVFESYQLPRTDDRSFHEFKLKGSITANHTLQVGASKFEWDMSNRSGWGSRIARREAWGPQKDVNDVITADYTGILGASTFISARYQWSESKGTWPKGDPAFGDEMVELWGDYKTGVDDIQIVGFPFGLGHAPKDGFRKATSWGVEVKHIADWFGSHEIDLGLDSRNGELSNPQQVGTKNAYFRVGGAFVNRATDDWRFPVIRWTGPYSIGQSGSGRTGMAPYMEQYYGEDGVTKNSVLGLYINDAWTINDHWNLMVGVRYDKLGVKDTDGSTMAKPSDFSPRFSLKYDVNGDGRHVFTLTGARFNGDINAAFTSSFVKSAQTKSARLGWTGAALGEAQPLPGLYNLDGNDNGNYGLRWVPYSALTNPLNYALESLSLTDPYGLLVDPDGPGPDRPKAKVLPTSNAFYFMDQSQAFVVDPDLKSPYKDEFTLGYRRDFGEGSFFSATYVHAEWKRDWAVRQDYDPSGQNMVVMVDPSGSGKTLKAAQTFVYNSNHLKRTFDSLELQWQMRLSSIWTLGGNYTYGHLIGNTNGGDDVNSSFRDNGPTGPFNNRLWKMGVLGLSEKDFAPTGRLSNDVEHRARLLLTALVPLGRGHMTFGWAARYDSGNPWSLSNTSAMMMGTAPGGVAAPTVYSLYHGGRGQYTNMDSFRVDFKISWNIPVGYKKLSIIGDIAVENFFNTNMQTWYPNDEISNEYGYYFNEPTTYFLANPYRFGKPDPAEDNYWLGARNVTASFGFRF